MRHLHLSSVPAALFLGLLVACGTNDHNRDRAAKARTLSPDARLEQKMTKGYCANPLPLEDSHMTLVNDSKEIPAGIYKAAQVAEFYADAKTGVNFFLTTDDEGKFEAQLRCANLAGLGQEPFRGAIGTLESIEFPSAKESTNNRVVKFTIAKDGELTASTSIEPASAQGGTGQLSKNLDHVEMKPGTFISLRRYLSADRTLVIRYHIEIPQEQGQIEVFGHVVLQKQ